MNAETQKKPTMRRSTRILLVGSLAVNLLVAGLVVGAVVAHWQGDDGPRRSDIGFASPYTKALSHADRRAIGKAIRKHHRKAGENRAVIARQYQEVVTLLRAPSLDVPAVRGILAQQRQTAGSRHETAQLLWLDRLEQMTDAERGAYAERLQEILSRGARDKPPRPPRGN